MDDYRLVITRGTEVVRLTVTFPILMGIKAGYSIIPNKTISISLIRQGIKADITSITIRDNPYAEFSFETVITNFTPFNPTTQNWGQYISSYEDFRFSVDDLQRYTYSILMINTENTVHFYLFNSLEFLQGIITTFNWLGINPHTIIKYVVQNSNHHPLTF